MYKWEKDGFVQGRSSPNNWREVCKLRKEAIDKEQQSSIKDLQIKGSILQQKEKEIISFFQSIGGGKPDDVLRVNVIKGRIFSVLVLVLLTASFFFLKLSFEPFQLREKGILIALGTALATAFFMEVFLTSFYERKYIICSFSSVGLVFILFAHVLFAILRANILKQLVISAEEDSAIYGSLLNILRIAIPLVALALEISCGLALHGAIERLLNPEVQSKQRLKIIRNKMAYLASEIERRKILADIFEKEFSVGALRAEEELRNKKESSAISQLELDKPKMEIEKKIAIYIVIILLLIFFFAIYVGSLYAEEPVVVALDMSGSTKTSNQNSESEFQKNIESVEKVISKISPGSEIALIGITDNSFSKPFIILKQKIGKDPGYFKEKIRNQRKNLISEWKSKVRDLKPIFLETDVFGAINLSSVLFSESQEARKILIIFSDLKHSAGEINLEKPLRLNADNLLEKAKRLMLIPKLKNVEVYCLGVSTSNKSFEYWTDLKRFWEGYLKSSGAVLKKYSINREVNYD